MNLKIPDFIYKFIHGHYPELPGLPIKNPDESRNKGSDQRNVLSDVLGDSGIFGNSNDGTGNNQLVDEKSIQNKPHDQNAARAVVLDSSLGDPVHHSINNNLQQINSQIIIQNKMETPQKDTWLSRTFSKLVNWLTKEKSQLHDLTIVADNIGTALVKEMASPVYEAIKTALEMAIPASTGLFNAFELELPNIMVRLGWTIREEGKTDEQIILDGLSHIKAFHIGDPDAFAVKIAGLVSLAGKFFSSNMGVAATIQQWLTLNQMVHNPNLLDVSIPQPVQPVYKPLDIPQQLTPVEQKAFDTVNVDTNTTPA